MTATGAAPRLIDGHVHAWDPRLLRYPWLDGLPQFDRPILPPQGDGSIGAVFIEADRLPEHALDEVRFAEALAWPGLAAIVAYAPLHLGAAVAGRLESLLAGHPLARGVRRLLQDEPAGALADPALIAGLRAAASAGLSFDATVRAQQLGELAAAHEASGDLVLVLDHLGNPPVADGLASERGQAWLSAVTAVARHPLATVKLSGAAMTTHAGIPFALAALELFGVDRALLGSDAPLSVDPEPEAYQAWADAAGRGLGLDGADLAELRHGTAQRVYRIEESAGSSSETGAATGRSTSPETATETPTETETTR